MTESAHEKNVDALRDKKKREAQLLAVGFFLVLGVVILDLVARNVWKDQYGSRWNFYIVWQASAITFTIVLTIFHWLKYINRGTGSAYTDVLATDNRKFHVGGLIFLSALALIIAGLIAIYIGLYEDVEGFALEKMLIAEVGCLTLGVVFIVWAELKVVKAVPEAKAKADKTIAELEHVLSNLNEPDAIKSTQTELSNWKQKRSDYDDILDDVGKFLAFSDAPIAVAFSVILLVVFSYWLGWSDADVNMLPPFIAGAVALQLLYSNFVFYIEANGAFPKWIIRIAPGFNEVTPMIQGQYRMQNAQFTDQSHSIESNPNKQASADSTKVPIDLDRRN